MLKYVLMASWEALKRIISCLMALIGGLEHNMERYETNKKTD